MVKNAARGSNATANVFSASGCNTRSVPMALFMLISTSGGGDAFCAIAAWMLIIFVVIHPIKINLNFLFINSLINYSLYREGVFSVKLGSLLFE